MSNVRTQMPKFHIALLALLLAACSHNPVPSDSWNLYTLDVSGKMLSFSAPNGHFRDVYVPHIDLSRNEKTYRTLFSRAWVFSELMRDKGGLDFIVGLHRVESSDSEEGFLLAVKKHASEELKDIRQDGVSLHNIRKKRMGDREWICYSLSNITSECALRLDDRHYISWTLGNVDNTSSIIDARDELKQKIENSLRVAF
jgi:hypothetical protein